MSELLPQVTRVYQNHHVDSTRWGHFTPRDDDIIISTSYKSGTTWMQAILKHLILQNTELENVMSFSRWIDARWNAIDDVIEQLESQTHRRCIKSHLAFDGLPYHPQVKYIVVARDGRDVFMSLWNHYANYNDSFYEKLDMTPDRVGELMPRWTDDIHELWKLWTTTGWFEWESEGYPFWGNLHHTQTYWNHKGLPNILFVHYNNLLNHAHTEIRRIADYLEIDSTDEHIDNVVQLTSFKNMKKKSDQLIGLHEGFKGGSKAFINKGTNGRWKDVFSEEELELYHAAVKRVLSPDCAHWLETGQMTAN